jgi:hypothetical protein
MQPVPRVVAAAIVILALAACSSNPASTNRPSAKATVATGGAGAGATPPANATLPAGVTSVPAAADVDRWSLSAVEYEGQNGTRYGYWCPPGGTTRTIWGTDLYTDDSSVCTAGVHVGAITVQGGGFVVIEMRPGADSYAASTRNGVDSQAYERWGGSYVVVKL